MRSPDKYRIGSDESPYNSLALKESQMIPEYSGEEHRHEDYCQSCEYDESSPYITNFIQRLTKSLETRTEILYVHSSLEEITKLLYPFPKHICINSSERYNDNIRKWVFPFQNTQDTGIPLYFSVERLFTGDILERIL